MQATSQEPDLMILDLRLPNTNDMKVTRQFRTH